MVTAALPRRGLQIFPLTLTRDGRLAKAVELERLARAAESATDCFVFCHGWLYDQTEAREEAARFFALLDTALRPLGDRVVPLRLGLHWPSKPFADPDRTAGAAADQGRPSSSAPSPGTLARRVRSLSDCCSSSARAEVPLGPEEESSSTALVRQSARPAPRERDALAASRAQLLAHEAAGGAGGRAAGARAAGAALGARRTGLRGFTSSATPSARSS